MKEGALEHLDELDPHFSEFPWNVTLEPLRTDGAEALNFAGLAAACVRGASLRELEIHSNNALHEVTICKSDNLFHRAHCGGAHANPIPLTGTLVRACIDVHLRGEAKPRKLLIYPPHSVQLFPPCAPGLLWSLLEKFRLHQAISKVLALLGLACLVPLSQFLEPVDYDDDHRHRSCLVARN